MNNILEGLNDMQKQAVQCTEGPLLILAGAGSGKTRVLTYRVAYLISECNVSPYNIMAVTFTNKAAGELKERIADIVGPGSEAVWASTFHSTCVKILRRFIDLLDYDRSFVIYDRDDQRALMKDILKSFNLDPKRYKDKTFLNVISGAKDELIGPAAFIELAGRDPEQMLYGKVYDEYQKRLHSNNALDFDDLIFKTVQLFKFSPDTLEYYRRRFRYIMVDEYQDTNTAQFELIRLLAEYTNAFGEKEHNLCVVGDDDQSIYRFRGANIRNILDFEKNYPDATVIRLEQNYRSTKNILETANEVIRNNTSRKSKKLWTENEQGVPVSFKTYPADRDEASDVIGRIQQEVREGASYKDYAILYRTNAQSRLFEEALVLKGIPYRIIGSINFYQRKEIKDLLAYLRVLASAADDISVRRIINIPKRGIGATSLDKLSLYAAQNDINLYDVLFRVAEDTAFSKALGVGRAQAGISGFVSLIESFKSRLSRFDSLTDMVDELIDGIDYYTYLEDEENDSVKLDERKENIGELISKLSEYEDSSIEENEPPTLSGFLEEIALVGDIDNYSEDADTVVLMTIHSAKGLEFNNVFLVGMEEGIFPSSMSLDSDDPEEELAEERRLCYVGITRAKKNLYLSACSTRMMHGNLAFNAVSRFIREIPRHLLNMQNSGSGRSNTIGGNKAVERFANAQDTHSRAFREKDAGYHTGNVRLNDNPYMNAFTKDRNASASKGDAPEYSEGDKVRHVKFGTGTVTKLIKMGKDYEVTVEFPAGVKKMLASFAKLKKAED